MLRDHVPMPVQVHRFLLIHLAKASHALIHILFNAWHRARNWAMLAAEK